MPGLKKLFFPSSSSRTSPRRQNSRRLTRQHKLRHVTSERLGLSLAIPQPLPLPEFKRGRESGHSKCDHEDLKNESLGMKASSLGSAKSSLSPQPTEKTTKSEKAPTYFRRGFPVSRDDGDNIQNFRLNVPARSAPTSGLSSPMRDPQRFNSVDFVFSCSSNPQINFSSISNDNISSKSDRHFNTPDYSPLNSPKQKSVFPKNNKQDCHPLPLPPSSPKPIQSPKNTNSFEKIEALSSKSKWIKGKLIGHGTYGTVYEAFNSETGAMCAMKEVDVLLDDPKSVECIKQLEQEIKILQHLEHKNIVRYYSCELMEDRFCIYLEYVYPGSISKYVREHFGTMTESVVRNFTRHILSGLAYLHSTDTVHRDIKGANLLVDASGTVKLADFGLAKHLSVAAYDLSMKGSPHWMAPELLQSVMRKDTNQEHAYAIDIWSLGCTVIEMFNGKPPWSECTGYQALFHVMNKSPVIPESLSLEGKDFLKWCFKRNPADRPLAAQLLKHPFVRTTQEQQGFSSCALDFSELKLADVSCSPREKPSICRSLPTSPKSNRRSNCEKSKAATHQSLRSTLEALPISSPEFHNSSANLRFSTRYDYQNKTRKVRKGFFRSFEGL